MKEFNKDSVLSKCFGKAHQIEIHYESESEEAILASVQFPYNTEVTTM